MSWAFWTRSHLVKRVSERLTPQLLGLDPNCAAPFDGWLLLGIRDDESSTWLRLYVSPDSEPHLSCSVAFSDTLAFPDTDFLQLERPVVMAAGRIEHWRAVGTSEFKSHLLDGDIEIGGDFVRFRRNLEWLLEHAERLRFDTRLERAIEELRRAS